MLPWLPFERRWRDAVIRAMVPLSDPEAPADLGPFWAAWAERAPPLLRLGLRTSVWAVTLAGLRHGRPFHRLDAARQDALLAAVVGHRSWAVRQLGVALKLTAGFALAFDEGTRARLEPR